MDLSCNLATQILYYTHMYLHLMTSAECLLCYCFIINFFLKPTWGAIKCRWMLTDGKTWMHPTSQIMRMIHGKYNIFQLQGWLFQNSIKLPCEIQSTNLFATLFANFFLFKTFNQCSPSYPRIRSNSNSEGLKCQINPTLQIRLNVPTKKKTPGDCQ